MCLLKIKVGDQKFTPKELATNYEAACRKLSDAKQKAFVMSREIDALRGVIVKRDELIESLRAELRGFKDATTFLCRDKSESVETAVAVGGQHRLPNGRFAKKTTQSDANNE